MTKDLDGGAMMMEEVGMVAVSPFFFLFSETLAFFYIFINEIFSNFLYLFIERSVFLIYCHSDGYRLVCKD